MGLEDPNLDDEIKSGTSYTQPDYTHGWQYLLRSRQIITPLVAISYKGVGVIRINSEDEIESRDKKRRVIGQMGKARGFFAFACFLSDLGIRNQV